MRLYEAAALAAWILNIALALFVIAQDARSRLHRAFFAWGVGMAMWNLGAYFLYQPIPPDSAYWWARLMQLGLIITPLGLYETARNLAGNPEKRRGSIFFAALHSILALTLFTPWFIRELEIMPFGQWPLPGPFAILFSISYAYLTLSAARMLHRAASVGTTLHRTRLRALLGAVIFLIVASVHDSLPSFGMERYPLVLRPFFPLGSIAACVYMFLAAYSVLQSRLLDAQLPLSRIAAHLVRFGFLALSSLILLLGFTAVVPDRFNDVSFVGAILVQVLGALVASVFFPRLFGMGLETVERRILGDQPDYMDEVRTFVQGMHWHGDLPALSADLHRLLTVVFKLQSYALHLRAVTGEFQLFRAHPTSAAERTPPIAANSPIMLYFEWTAETCLTRQPQRRPGWEEEEDQARAQLEAAGAFFCFPLRVQEEPIGFLMLGPKRNDDPLTPADILLLTAVVNTLGLVVNQIRLKTQVRQAQEFELLGRMSSGLAHDLNNLLTPVSTLLQLSKSDGKVNEDLLPVAIRNVAAVRDYIREGLFFSQHQRPDFQLTRLDSIVERAREVALNSRACSTPVEMRIRGEYWAEVDPVMIQRLLSNLLTNAIDASPDPGRVIVSIDRLTRAEEGREWLRLRVVDQGEGISADDRARVFSPFFTTKNRGDRRRGFGLGLAICRKIAALHGGELSLESSKGKGTTVAFDFPTRQIPAKETAA